MAAKETILKATSYFGGECLVRFSESGYQCVKDDRKVKDGYLHIFEESPDEITELCRDQMIRYFFNHHLDLPGIGATPQTKYFKGLTIKDLEKIGNNGQQGYYANVY